MPTTSRTRTRAAKISPVQDETIAPWEEDEAPVQQRPRRRQVEEEPEPVAEVDVEDEGDEETVIPVSIGRSQIKRTRPGAEGSGGNSYFRWADDGDSQVVKFLDTAPWSYNQHWVTRAGKQSFPCLGKDCPLCDIGATISQKIVYTIVNLSQPGMPVQTMEVTPTLEETLAAYDEDKKTGPLHRNYWALSRTKAARSTNQFAKYNYSFLPIKERDLEEDYDISLDEVDEAVQQAEVPTPQKVLGKVTRRMIEEVADEVVSR